MSYDPNSLPVGGSDAMDYWSLDWDAPKVEGGIDAFDGVDKPDRTKEENGIISVAPGPPTELPGGIIDDEDEDLIAT